jgi:hypothetical protein
MFDLLPASIGYIRSASCARLPSPRRLPVDAGHELEQLGRHVLRRADAARGEVELAGLALA